MDHYSLITTVYSGSSSGGSNSVFLTVLSGALVAVCGLIAKELLSYYILNPNQAFQGLRTRTAELLAKRDMIPCFVTNEREKNATNQLHAVADECNMLAAAMRAFAHQRNIFLASLPTRSQFIQLSRDIHDSSPLWTHQLDQRKERRKRIYSVLQLVDPETVPENFKKDVAFFFKRPELLTFRVQFFSPSPG
jgi:hypothetical protein